MGDDVKNDYTITINDSSEHSSQWVSGPVDYKFSTGHGDLNYDTNTVTINLDSLNDTGTEFSYNTPEFDKGTEFVDYMPDMDKLKSMCEEYPGLKKAYNYFINMYKLVDQDYRGKLKAGEVE